MLGEPKGAQNIKQKDHEKEKEGKEVK